MKKIRLVFLIILFVACSSKKVYAAALEEYDFGDMEDFFEENDVLTELSFKELVQDLMKNGFVSVPKQFIRQVDKLLLGEIRQNQKILKMAVALALMSSVFVQFTIGFENSQVSKTAMLIARLFNVILLVKGFDIVFEVMDDFFSQLVDFINCILPVYAFSVTFSTGTMSGAALRQGSLIVIALLNYGVKYVLLPMIRIFVMMKLINSVTADNSFHKMCRLIKLLIIWLNNTMLAFVTGMNVIKSMVAPYADKTAALAFQKAVSVIPGIGSAVGGASELILGTGKFIRNSIGAAGLIVIVVLCMVPVVKTAVFSVLYHFCGAMIEPVADKKIVEGITGVADGVLLLLRISITGAMVCMLTIGMACV